MVGKDAPGDAGATAHRSEPDKVVSLDGRRLTYRSFPKPLKGDVPYAKCRPELADLSLGDMVRLVMASAAWREVMQPLLDELEAERPKKGPKPAYTSEELESCVLFQRLAGESTYAAARKLLAGDRGEHDRDVLGFNRPRKRVGASLRVVRSLDGVPSEVTVWRHKQRFGLDAHLAAYRELFARLVHEHFETFPEEMAEEARVVNWDGSVLLSHYCSFERKNKETEEVKPPTLHGGGYRPRTTGNAGKDGHGFNLIAAVTQTGLPLVERLTPIQTPEGKTARSLLDNEWREVVAGHLQDDLVGVMAFDAAYSGREVREAVHRAGFVPNCHPVSHGLRKRSQRNARRTWRRKLKIPDKPNWRLNGHRELECACGEGKTVRRATKNRKGEAVARLEGQCPTCKGVTLTAGQWRVGKVGSANGIRPVLKGEELADWSIGNPLTFYDPLSARYGSARFGHGEGFHGAMVTRFGLLRGKSWYRDARQAERDALQVFCIMHVLAMEQRRRKAAKPTAGRSRARGGGPPPPRARAA